MVNDNTSVTQDVGTMVPVDTTRLSTVTYALAVDVDIVMLLICALPATNPPKLVAEEVLKLSVLPSDKFNVMVPGMMAKLMSVTKILAPTEVTPGLKSMVRLEMLFVLNTMLPPD